MRTEKLEVRATAEELARYQEAARFQAMSLSGWVRMVLENAAREAQKPPISRDFADR